jgi:hypothetical protein
MIVLIVSPFFGKGLCRPRGDNRGAFDRLTRRRHSLRCGPGWAFDQNSTFDALARVLERTHGHRAL